MILYTEKQLLAAYSIYIAELRENNNIPVKEPTLEEFRDIYEAEMELRYNPQQEIH